MFKKLWNRLKVFFSPLETKKRTPRLDYEYPRGNPLGALLSPSMRLSEMYTPTVNEEQFRRNMQQIELIRLEQDRESTNNNLKAQHRALIITTFAVLVAVFSSLLALYIALNDKPPVVNVQASPAPNVIVEPPNIKVKCTLDKGKITCYSL